MIRAVIIGVTELHETYAGQSVERAGDGLHVSFNSCIGVGEPAAGGGLGCIAGYLESIRGGHAADADEAARSIDRETGRRATVSRHDFVIVDDDVEAAGEAG